MDTKKLKILMEAVRVGSLRKASATLNYSQPALTSMMDSLEQELGFPLLERGSKGVRLTDKGNALRPYIEELLKADSLFVEKVSELTGARSLTIAALPSIGNYWLPSLVAAFSKKHPEVNIKIMLSVSRAVDWVRSGKADFALCDLMHAEDLDSMDFLKDPYYAVVEDDGNDNDEPVDLQKWLSENTMLLASDDPKDTLLNHVHHYKIKKVVHITTNNVQVLMRMVIQGAGITLLSSMHEHTLVAGCKMLPTEPMIARTLGVCALNLDNLSPLAKEFIQDTIRYIYDNNIQKDGV